MPLDVRGQSGNWLSYLDVLKEFIRFIIISIFLSSDILRLLMGTGLTISALKLSFKNLNILQIFYVLW
jgi:hypothetical protein